MNLDFNLVVGALVVTAIIAFALAVYSWRRRELGDWAISFSILALAIAIWSLAYSFELVSQTLAAKIFWAKIQYIGIVITPLAWFVFALQYTSRAGWLTRRWLIALCFIPFFSLLFVFTNESLGLIWSSTKLTIVDTIPLMDVTYGFWFWIHSVYSYSLMLIGTIVLFQAYLRLPKTFRSQNASLVLGASLPLVANVIFVSGILPTGYLDITTFAFSISALLMAMAIFRYHLFDIVPVARRTAVDNMRDGMVVVDLHNRVIDINPAAQKLFRRPASDMIGYPLGEFLQDQQEVVNSFRDVTEAESEIAVNMEDQELFFALHISPLYDTRENVSGRLIVFYDITSRKQAEREIALARDEALEASHFKTELLARVSHELRTPLNVILGYTEMMQEGVFGPISQNLMEPTDKIIESTEFLSKQVNELLDLSKLEIGQITLYNQEFKLADLITRVCNQMTVLAEAKQVMLVSEIESDVPSVIYGDPTRIEQILLNLIGNGIKFSRKGIVRLSVCRPDEGHWLLEVSDQGVGIPPELQQSIFEPFIQVDGSLTRLHQGTGLGLAIVKQMTELMDGEIELQSEVGQGSKFIVRLPLLSPNGKAL